MNKSIKVDQKKGRGRPATGRGVMVSSRMPDATVTTVDAWAVQNETTRSDAIRRLVELGLRAKKGTAGAFRGRQMTISAYAISPNQVQALQKSLFRGIDPDLQFAITLRSGKSRSLMVEWDLEHLAGWSSWGGRQNDESVLEEDKASKAICARAATEAERAEGEGGMTGEMRTAPDPWTPEDNERLRKLAAEGRTIATIAERLKRSPESVRRRAVHLNIVLARAKRKGRLSGISALVDVGWRRLTLALAELRVDRRV